MYAVTIGATVGVITLILDGVAAKQLADQWAAAPEPAKPTALALVSANETINFALAGLFNLSSRASRSSSSVSRSPGPGPTRGGSDGWRSPPGSDRSSQGSSRR
jgi:hypothetical protein